MDKPEFVNAFRTFANWVGSKTGRKLDEIRAGVILADCQRRGAEKATRDLEFSILKDSANLLDSDHDFSKPKLNTRDGPAKPTKDELRAKLGITT